MLFVHSPVLVGEILNELIGVNDSIFLDATCGEGGHSEAVLDRFEKIRAICFDRDREILEVAKMRFLKNPGRVETINSNFTNVLNFVKPDTVDSILVDLGISVFHYKKSGKGFSFSEKEKLDMRLDNESISVYDIINTYTYEELIRIFYSYGEEKFSKVIARKIIGNRMKKPIEYSNELADIVSLTIPKKFQGKIHPATKIFQALRIEANSEFDNIKKGIPDLLKILKPGGKMGVITFHSLEDRIVKNIFKEMSLSCVCPPTFPQCICDKKKEVNIHKLIIPGEDETKINPPSRSAKLRIVTKI